jgi:hypothetical protein
MRSTLAILLLTSTLFSAGCAPSNPGLVIDGVVAPPTGGACIFDPAANAFLFSGVLDTTDQSVALEDVTAAYFGIRYVAHLRLSNNLINLFNGTYPVRADPNVMLLMSADVEILQIDGSRFDFSPLPNPFRVTVSGTVDSAVAEAPGIGLTAVEVIPPQYGARLAGLDNVRLNAVIRITGRTTGDATVQTAEFFYPIDLCANCLYGCSAEAIGEASCDIGQDGFTLLPAGVGGCPPAL